MAEKGRTPGIGGSGSTGSSATNDRALAYAADLVTAIDGVDRLLAWWLTEVCPQFGDEPAGGRAVLLPGRRCTLEGGRRPACAVTLRDGDQRPEPVPLGLRSAARP
ncbi:hypothetical protein [Streptomyces sp. NPDC002685]|uniref:hypothetical protein n=1 Tax=Streptomyces sp. NPDC002685 TaxID=3154540 RepID=UPI003317F12E